MKKTLITGGAGFIGSNFIRHILNKYNDYEVVNLDNLTYCGNIENLRDCQHNQRYQFIKGDICDQDLVDSVVKKVDSIVHFAAESHVDRSIDSPLDFFHTNVYGTQVLLEAAKRHKIHKVIQISSDEVYGSIEGRFSKERDPLEPNSPYSASKAAADMLAQSYYRTYNVPAIIVRPSNNFGQYQFPEKLVSLFITNTLEDKSLPLYADGMNTRDWIYVVDNCEAIDTVLHKGEIGEIYNIGGGNHLTNLEITNLILEMLNKPKSLIKFVKDRPGHDKRYALDTKKIRRLGWRPKHDFKEALKKTVEWYKDNRSWWENLKNKVA